MRNIFLTVLFVFGFISFSSAQSKGFYYYTRAAIGSSNFNSSNIGTQTGKLALNIGIAGQYQFNDYLGIIAEANFSSKGTKFNSTEPATFTNPAKTYEDVYRLFYAEIPVLINFSYPLSDAFYARGFTGLSNNFNLMGTFSRNYSDAQYQDIMDEQLNGIKLLEQATVIGFGLGVKDKNEHLYTLDFRWNNALNEFGELKNSQNSVIKGKNSYYTIGFGYSF